MRPTFAVALMLAAAPLLAAGPDPQMKAVLDAHKALRPKPLHTLTPAAARRQPTARDAVLKVLRDSGRPTTPEAIRNVQDRTVPGAAGPVRIRIYAPDAAGALPVIVYWHGGGFVVADLDVYDASPRALANQAKAIVVSAHYRQAPEHPFPAAADDATAVYRWVHDHAGELGGDPSRMAVAGESAGGNLATVVAMRQKGRPAAEQPKLQLLVYPFVSNDLSTPSHAANGQGAYLIGNPDLAWFWRHDLGPSWEKERESTALPIYATSAELKGLPPAFVITAALDPLLDEGRSYARKLQDAGVPVTLVSYEGVTHEFFGMAAVVDTAKKAQADAGAALRAALARR